MANSNQIRDYLHFLCNGVDIFENGEWIRYLNGPPINLEDNGKY